MPLHNCFSSYWTWRYDTERSPDFSRLDSNSKKSHEFLVITFLQCAAYPSEMWSHVIRFWKLAPFCGGNNVNEIKSCSRIKNSSKLWEFDGLMRILRGSIPRGRLHIEQPILNSSLNLLLIECWIFFQKYSMPTSQYVTHISARVSTHHFPRDVSSIS